MINPTFKDTIAIFHQRKEYDEGLKKTVSRWIRVVLSECFWGTQMAENLNGTTLSQTSSYTVRIPQNKACIAEFNGAGFSLAPGDIIIKGNIKDEIEDAIGKRPSDILNKYNPNSFTVRTFSDNTKIPHAAHYKVTGV